MKKLKINDLPELLAAIKKSEYSFNHSPSLDPTYLIIHEETKKVRFEYSKEDVYTDYELVDIDFFGNNEIDNELLKVDADFSISIMCNCPHCYVRIDLYDNKSIRDEIGEDNQARGCDVTVKCTSCNKSFIVENVNF